MPGNAISKGLTLVSAGLLLAACDDAGRPVAPTDPAPAVPRLPPPARRRREGA